MSDIKIKARELKNQGISTRKIAKLIGVSKSTIHTWTKDIVSIDKRIILAREMRTNGKPLSHIAKELKSCPQTIRSWTKDIILSEDQKLAIRFCKKRKYHYNEELFKKPNELTYYLLGVFISDGNIEQNRRVCRLNSKDKDWLQSIASIFCINKKIFKRKNKTGFYYDLSISNKFIAQWFINNECIPKKSLTVKFPNIPKKYLSHFTRGIFDGDGNISIIKMKGNTYKLQSYIVSGSKEFAEKLSKTLNSINITNKLYEYKTKSANYSYRISWQGKPTINFCKFIYSNADIFLKRKKEKFEKYQSWRLDYEKS